MQGRWPSFAVCLFLGLCVWAVFGQTLHYDFVNFDDDKVVYENPTVSKGLTVQSIPWAFTHSQVGHWDPLTTLSHMLDCSLFGLHPWGHHLGNVVLHTVAVILLFLMMKELTGAFWESAFVAAIFAVHPLRVESVAWITERKDLLSGVFFMLTLWMYARHVRRPQSKRYYIWVVLLFLLGLLSKSMLVTLPFVLLLLDYWPLKRFEARDGTDRPVGRREVLLEKIPLLLISLIFASVQMTSAGPGLLTLEKVPLAQRLGNAAISYVVYLRQMVWPADLAVFYPHPLGNLHVEDVVMAGTLLCAVSAGVIVVRNRQPWLLVGWLWYLGMLVPVIGIVQSGDLARADRYTYLPQIGLYILATWGATDLCKKWSHGHLVLGSVAVTILGSLLAAAYVQTGNWKNNVSLWTHTLACTSGNYIAHFNFGHELGDHGKLDEAIEQFQKGLQITPDDAKAHYLLGVALAGKSRSDEAIKHYRRALQLEPDYPEAQNNLGFLLAGKGDRDEAIKHFERALQLRPDFAEADSNLGLALAEQGRMDEAIKHFEDLLRVRPDDPKAHNNLGNALAEQGNTADAISHWREAIRLKPDYSEAHCNLGIALTEQGKLDDAIQYFEKALSLAEAQSRSAMAADVRKKLEAIRKR